MKKCPRCMQSDNDSQRFCTYCGTELFFAEKFKEADESKKKHNFRLNKIFRSKKG